MINHPTDFNTKTPPVRFAQRRLVLIRQLVISIGLAFLCSAVCLGQDPSPDTVNVKRKNSPAPIVRTGKILEWKGATLTIRVNDNVRSIDNDDILSVITRWTPEYRQADKALAAGQAKTAVEGFNQALRSDPRPWAQRMIRAKLIVALMELDQPGAAAEHFLSILAEDSNTRLIDQIPLNWSNSTSQVNNTEEWMSNRHPAVQLLGASWAVSTPKRNQAIKVLEELTGDLNPDIRALATAQLWRTRQRVNKKQLEVWKKIIPKMPHFVRHGAFFVLARHLRENQQQEAAVIDWMKVITIYSKHRELASASLYQIAQTLQNQSKPKLAKSTLTELKKRFPQSTWAKQMQ